MTDVHPAVQAAINDHERSRQLLRLAARWKVVAEERVDAIGRLREDNKRLRAALTGMVNGHPFMLDGGDSAMTAAWFINAAKAALKGDSQ